MQPIHRFVVKVGSSVLTDEAGRLIPKRIEQLAEQISGCLSSSHQDTENSTQPILVSSGAIACGMAKLALRTRPKSLSQLQACAAIGQGELMHMYNLAFGKHAATTAQILLTQDDLSDRKRFRNAKQTLLSLLHRRVVPIINENDTVAVEEITFGDNDRLAALVACAIDAQLLIILSDVEGLMHDGKLVERIDAISRTSHAAVHATDKQTTKGGMLSKLEAARIVGHSGIPMVIASGFRHDVITEILSGKTIGTLFVPPRNRLTMRKWWIAFALRQPSGSVVIDTGAAEALSHKGKSLLASGVKSVKGRFDAGSCISVTNQEGLELARGISNYSSSELSRVCGMKTSDIANMLGRSKAKEVIHRDHLVLMNELHRG